MHAQYLSYAQIREWVQRNVSKLHENRHDTIQCHTESALIAHAMSNDCNH